LLPEYLGRQRVAAGLRRIPEGGASRLRALAGALFRPKTIPASGQGAKRVSRIACEGAPLGSRRKRGEWAQAVGRSRGGRTSKIHKPGKPRVDDRRVISGILQVLKTGCRWRDVPPDTNLPQQAATRRASSC